MGLMKLSSAGLDSLKKSFHSGVDDQNIKGKLSESAYMTDLIQELVDNGYRVDTVLVSGGWIEMDTVEDLESKVTLERIRAIESANIN